MKRTTLFIFILFSFSLLKSQNTNLLKKIDWQENIKHHNSTIFSFYGANYIDNSYLPYFNDFINIPNGQNFDIELVNIKTEIIPNTKTNNINIENVQQDFVIKTETSNQRKEAYLNIEILPLRRNSNNQIEKLVEFEYNFISNSEKKSTAFKKHSFANGSVLSSGDWYRIQIKESGVYKITFDELESIGISNPANISVFGNGGGMLPINHLSTYKDDLHEIAIKRISNGSESYILFYAEGPNTFKYDTANQFYQQHLNIYSDFSYYFLTSNAGNNKTIQNISSSSQTANQTFDYYDEIVFHETDDTNLIRSGRNWFGEQFLNDVSDDFEFETPNRITSQPFRIKLNVAARSSINFPDNNFEISINELSNIIEIPIGGVGLDSYTFGKSATILQSITSSQKDISINVLFDGGTSTAKGFIDYISLNLKSNLNFTNNQFPFRVFESAGESNVSTFQIDNMSSNISIWDITDHNDVKEINYDLSGSTGSFTLQTDELKEFIAFNDTYLSVDLSDENVVKIENQNLHALSPTDIIIITHPDFIAQANELAQIHETYDNLTSTIIEPQEIYNEFSSGRADVSAIRNFLKMFYDRAVSEDEIPKYLILFGDGSYDNKTNSASNSNYIITFQSSNSLSETGSFSSDDYFGLLDDDEGGDIEGKDLRGTLDIGIGRLPVQNTTEAQTVVNKIRNYIENKNAGDWQNMITFIADDADKNETIHMRDANILANYIEENYQYFNFDKIFLDAYQQVSTPSGERYPDVNKAINERIKKGTLLVNFTGHGNPTVMTHEHVLELNDVISWTNNDKLPLFITASCEISRYDDWARTSAGEYILISEKGGGIGLLTTTRVVFAGANMSLNTRFYHYVFAKNDQGNYHRLGDIVRLTKNATGSITSNNKRNFTLLGDPALQICLPEYQIQTTRINNTDINSFNDTLKALSKVHIEGVITEIDGTTKVDADGVLYPLVFDKKFRVVSLANDDNDTFEFYKQSNILFKGKASVTNGEFDFEFIVPKDIAYNIDFGRLSFFASINNKNATGYFNNFLIGGSGDNFIIDETGPEIELFLNDSLFVNGGITDGAPKIIAYVFDENGINTSGNGIGHDITAILDNDNANNYILNDYYESDIDSYKSGKIEYPLDDIEPGEHSLRLKVWDVLNNSSEDFIEFYVTESENLKIENLLNYPNPFTTNTDFYFEHNQPNKNIEAIIQIYTISGKLIKSIPIQFYANGFRSEPINWDGKDEFGDAIGKGVYLYKLIVKTEDGMSANKIEKLVILK